MDVHTEDSLGVGEFIVTTRIESIGKDKKGDRIFFGKINNGQLVLFHARFHCPPVIDSDEIVASVPSEPGVVVIGTLVHGVCQNGPMGPRAVRWCLQTDLNRCHHALEVAVEADRERSVRVEAARLEQLAFDEMRRTEKPTTVDEAVARGWEIFGKTDGRQRTLKRQFEGETKPRTITLHLSEAFAVKPKKSKRSLVAV